MEVFQRQHNRATKRKGNKQDQAELAAAATKNALRVVGDSKAGSQQRGEAEEANGDPHSEVVARPTLTQITFHSLSLIKLPMRPKRGGTFFLTSTSQRVVKRARGERNVSY